jgi:hypothetical protein
VRRFATLCAILSGCLSSGTVTPQLPYLDAGGGDAAGWHEAPLSPGYDAAVR